MNSQISQSRQRTLTLTLGNRRRHFSRTFSLFSRSSRNFFLSFRSRKSVTPLFGILRNFGVFILAKRGGLFNKFNTYFFYGVWTLASFFVTGFFTLYKGRDFITFKSTKGLDFSLLGYVNRIFRLNGV